MPIEFRKVTEPTSPNTSTSHSQQEAQKTPALPQIPPASKAQVEDRLFHFLCSVCNGRPRATDPLLVEVQTLHALYNDPHPDLIVALQHCLDQFLIELGPDTACWGSLDLPTTVLGVVLATYNCLCPLPELSEVKGPVLPFTSALIATLPPARTLAEMLVYHALLRHTVEPLSVWSEDRAVLVRALFDLSPLSAVHYLHLHTPPALTVLAASIWSWWKSRVVNPTPWANISDWLHSLTLLLAQPVIAKYLRRRWLSMSDAHLACRNLGLLLEALRRRGGQRAVILEFYEAFDYFRAEQVTDPGYGQPRWYWPLLDQTEHLLRADGDSEAAIQLNRRGNEYFMLFRPLLQIIIDEGGLPHDYNHLTLDFVHALCSLLPLTTETLVPHPQTQNVEFISEDGA